MDENPDELPPPPAPRVTHINDASSDAIYIGRAMPQHKLARQLLRSPWANDHRPASDSDDDRADAVRKYATELVLTEQANFLPELAGRELACWCHPKRCHGDALVELVGSLRWCGATCPGCGDRVRNWLDWYDDHAQALVERWECDCGRTGKAQRPIPPCLQPPGRLL